jgi:hypothetical protein
MLWLWIVPWVEVVCLLAVIFAFGIGMGFGGSALVRAVTRKPQPRLQRKAPRPEPHPIVMEPAPEPMPVAAFTYPETAVPTTPEIAPEPIVMAPEPEPEPAPPAEPAFQTITYREMTRAAYCPVAPFSAAVTRPTAGHPVQPPN